MFTLEASSKAGILSLDLNQLRVKVRKVRDLFVLNSPDGEGAVTVDDLMVTLQAGRLGEGELASFQEAFSHEKSVKFFDFLVYMPLFTNIHEDIMNNTLAEEFRELTEQGGADADRKNMNEAAVLHRAAVKLHKVAGGGADTKAPTRLRGWNKVRSSKKGTWHFGSNVAIFATALSVFATFGQV